MLSFSFSDAPWRYYLRQEPDAAIPHVRIRAGGRPHGRSLPRQGSTLNDHTPSPIFCITCAANCAQDDTSLPRKKAAGKGKEEEMKYTVPGSSPPLWLISLPGRAV